jgi:hypothetical protein
MSFRTLRRRLQTTWRERHTSYAPIVVLFGLVAVATTLLNQPDVWIADGRFELFEEPLHRLRIVPYLWDTQRGFGTFRTDLWLGNTLPLAAFREVGLTRAQSQHAWHGLLLWTAGVGAVAFLRCFVPRVGIPHVVTGTIYMLGPYSVAFLLPSVLYFDYAIAPWLWLVFVAGVRADNWRGPAAFAVLLGLVGTAEPPGVIYACWYLVPLGAGLILVRREATFGQVIRWIRRAGVLSAGVMVAPVAATVLAGEVFAQNLRETENPLTLSGNSSWFESWRGLGGWLIYHRDSTGPAVPQVGLFLRQPAALVVSGLLPVLAVLAAVLLRNRDRLIMAAMMLSGLVLMVGLYPPDDRVPMGRLVAWVFSNAGQVTSLRSTYKAGSGMVWATAALVGMLCPSIIEVSRRVGHRETTRAIALALVAAGLILTQPAWHTGIYDKEELRGIPSYVPESMAWLDAQPGTGRVLFLPGSFRSEFRWGNANDDVIDSMLHRPYLIETPIHTSRAVPADVLTAIDRSLVHPRYSDGEVAAYAERFGIRWVVLRNDFAWETWEQPRPAAFDPLRADPSLRLVATFGRRGEYTTDPTDTSAAGARERRLPPVEIYEVSTTASLEMVAVLPPKPPLLIAGDGEAVSGLARAGLLDDVGPIRFTGALSPRELADVLAEPTPAPVLLTDTNRRQVEVIGLRGRTSYALPDGQRLDRVPYQLFPATGSESVAVMGDAVVVAALGTEDPSGVLAPWARPGLAVDGVMETAWRRGTRGAEGSGVRVALREPRPLTQVTVHLLVPPGSAGPAAGVVRVSTPSEVVERAVVGSAVSFLLKGEPVGELAVALGQIDTALPEVGISEIAIAGVDLRESVMAATDVARAAAASSRVAAALAAHPPAYLLQQDSGDGLLPSEAVLSREVLAPVASTLQLSGQMVLERTVPDRVFAQLLGSSVVAVADGRLNDDVQYGGMAAVDGSSQTAWLTAGTGQRALEVEFQPKLVTSVEVDLRRGPGLATPREVTVAVGGEDLRLTPAVAPCEGTAQCTESLVAELDVAVMTGTVTVRVQGSAAGVVRVDEVRLNGVTESSGSTGGCRTGLLDVAGADVGLRFDLAALLDLAVVEFTSCEPVEVRQGSFEVRGAVGITFDTLLMTPPGWFERTRSTIISSASVSDVVLGRSSATATVTAGRSEWLVLRQSWHEAWRARLDGVDLGPPTELDGMAAWRLPDVSAGSVQFEFGWDRWYRLAVAVSALSLLVAIVLVGWPRRSEP